MACSLVGKLAISDNLERSKRSSPKDNPLTSKLEFDFLKSFNSFAALAGSSKEKANIVGPTNRSSKQENFVSSNALLARVFLITLRWTELVLASSLSLVKADTEVPW